MSPVVAGWAAVALSFTVALIVGPILERRMTATEERWRQETEALAAAVERARDHR